MMLRSFLILSISRKLSNGRDTCETYTSRSGIHFTLYKPSIILIERIVHHHYYGCFLVWRQISSDSSYQDKVTVFLHRKWRRRLSPYIYEYLYTTYIIIFTTEIAIGKRSASQLNVPSTYVEWWDFPIIITCAVNRVVAVELDWLV